MWGSTLCFQWKCNLKEARHWFTSSFSWSVLYIVQHIADRNIAVAAATKTVWSRKCLTGFVAWRHRFHHTYYSALICEWICCVFYNAEKVSIKGQGALSNNNLSCVFTCSCSTRRVMRAMVRRSTAGSLRGPSCSPSSWRKDATWSSETDAVSCPDHYHSSA